jgi:predicted transglutaminase-like cysteine proteinase
MINAPSNDEEIPKWIALREHVLDNYVALRVSCQWDDIQANNEHINTIIRWTGPDVKDNWQTPAETITKLSGDCMDIASYKYGQMRKSGFSDDQLGIVLCELTVGLMKNNPQHAFLIVEFNGVVKVLDSRFDHIIDPKDYINMIPLKFLYGPDVLLFAKQTTLSGEKVEPVA